MIYSVRGELIYKDSSAAVIECAGVGYLCRTTLSTISKLGQCGGQERLFTCLNVNAKDGSAELFGFLTMQELNCFKLLISVSGVGAKAALSILSDISPERFALLVASGDSKAFTKVKGIGAKTAQRITLELKDKIAKQDIISSGGSADYKFASHDFTEDSNVSEAFSALEALGYSNSEIMPVLSSLDESLPSAELIKLALKSIAAGKFK